MRALINHRFFPLFLGIAVVIVYQFSKTLMVGAWGAIGPDNDDIMRLLQIQDFLSGQSWFDVAQYRMGLDDGTAMHWSRIADIPILILTYIFDIFLPRETALVWAYSLWPPLTLAFVGYGLWVGARAIGPGRSGMFVMVLFAITYMGHFRFSPGAIDHHNLQLGLMAITLGMALDPEQRPIRFMWAGICLALSLTVGVEVYLFVALFCGFFALNWLFRGDVSRDATFAFGLSFALTLLLLFFVTTAPGRYLQIYCDSFSFITVIAGFGGGIGLALAARLLSTRTFTFRFAALAGLAAYAAALLTLAGPQCLSNPLDALPLQLRELWLGNVSETQPLFSKNFGRFTSLPFYLGTICVAIAITALQIYRRKFITQNFLIISLLGLSFALMIYQIRFYPFAALFAVIPLSLWVARLWNAGREKSGSNIQYLLAMFICVPAFWAAPGMIFVPDEFAEEEGKADELDAGVCIDTDVQRALDNLPNGRFAQLVNSGTQLLYQTGHSVMSGNYHRNIDGLTASFDLFGAPPDQAKELMDKYGVDYIYICRSQSETEPLVAAMPDGLITALFNDDTPEFLEEIEGTFRQGDVSIYRRRGR